VKRVCTNAGALFDEQRTVAGKGRIDWQDRIFPGMIQTAEFALRFQAFPPIEAGAIIGCDFRLRIPPMRLRPLLHTLMLGLLALCVGGLGPAALGALPRSLTFNMQEEERNSGEGAEIGSLGTSVLRPARPHAPAGRDRCRHSWPCDSLGLLSVRSAPAVAITLCALHVQIQV
jgi:hypothetical protein